MKKSTLITLGLATSVSASAGYYWANTKLFNATLVGHKKSVSVHDTDTSCLTQPTIDASIWFKKAPKKAVELKTFDGLTLKGDIIVHKECQKWIILAHGYKSTKVSMYISAQNFFEQGYNILVFDQRSHGNSDGKYIGMGWLEQNDLMDWIQYIQDIHSDAKIALYGVSMGAATVMNTTGNNLPENVVCAIEDCGFTSVGEILLSQMKKKYGSDFKALLVGFQALCKRKLGYDIFKASSVDQLKKSKTPTLFIHGTKDTYVPFEMVYHNYEACSAKKELLVVPDAGHALALLDDSYFKVIHSFLKKYM
ncbi:alpha/beta hydrolase [Tannockella kyphosi]|uniref:alpha/beta hydrolase n=1 Tax=Tannockella kyphosi TaxID=2899121 RepID=UPI0020126BAC|nr:alpha/beta hydrolase [Tannockella kyphosi]